ncbi:hypothetical protein ACQPXM_24220 [Kribbella sp. CA-253562]|uniref:hypothetical protein n=1 Tax=Kribbella sp. CA-253562 TaxID=3239942 RepID=UPI003D8DC991
MLIALLLVLGVNLTTVIALAVLVFGRRRWLKRQPGQFAGSIRVVSGALDGVGGKWKRGSGRWVRDVLVWSKAPLMFRNQIIPMDRLADARLARTGEVKRLGDQPVVVEFVSDEALVQLASRAQDRALAMGPMRNSG